MFTTKSFRLIAVLIVVVVSASAQTFPAPPPITQPPAQACGPIVDLAVGSSSGQSGMLIRTCQMVGGVLSANIIAAFDPGFIDGQVRFPDGTALILKDDGTIIQYKGNNFTQSYYAHQGHVFLRAGLNDAVVYGQQGKAPLEYLFNSDGSFSTRIVANESLPPYDFTQFFQVGSNQLFYVDGNNGKIYRSVETNPAGHVQGANAALYYEQSGIIYARPWRDGLLVLVEAQSDCGQATQIPGNAVFCYFAGQCKEISPAQLLYISGDSAKAIPLPYTLSLSYGATFSVINDVVYLVESEIDKDGQWLGDIVSKIDLVSQKKTSYLSRDDFFKKWGLDHLSFWLN